MFTKDKSDKNTISKNQYLVLIGQKKSSFGLIRYPLIVGCLTSSILDHEQSKFNNMFIHYRNEVQIWKLEQQFFTAAGKVSRVW